MPAVSETENDSQGWQRAWLAKSGRDGRPVDAPKSPAAPADVKTGEHHRRPRARADLAVSAVVLIDVAPERRQGRPPFTTSTAHRLRRAVCPPQQHGSLDEVTVPSTLRPRRRRMWTPAASQPARRIGRV